MKTHALLTAAALALASPALAQSPKAAKPQETKPQEMKSGDTAKAALQDAKGQPVGDVILEQTPHGVLIRGTLSNLPAGVHAIHIHEAGKCEAPEFKTAGGHFNPHKKAHGMLNPQGKHEGDLPNLTVGQDGKVQFEFFANQGLTVKSLQDTDGAAVVVHAKADDYKTDPAGDAGGRIACGVVSK
jgi:Cu-Zn family superoxide dismutase